jgi:hypothetical protein
MELRVRARVSLETGAPAPMWHQYQWHQDVYSGAGSTLILKKRVRLFAAVNLYSGKKWLKISNHDVKNF